MTGTLINYYIHCKRQCYLHGNRINLEDNSQLVAIGKALHDIKKEETNVEISIDNIKVDKITKDYIVEIKKSDADLEAAKWQLLYYLKVLKEKGIIRKGKLEVKEKLKSNNKIHYFELTEDIEKNLLVYEKEIENLLNDKIPEVLNNSKCKKCAYYEYCYI